MVRHDRQSHGVEEVGLMLECSVLLVEVLPQSLHGWPVLVICMRDVMLSDTTRKESGSCCQGGHQHLQLLWLVCVRGCVCACRL